MSVKQLVINLTASLLILTPLQIRPLHFSLLFVTAASTNISSVIFMTITWSCQLDVYNLSSTQYIHLYDQTRQTLSNEFGFECQNDSYHWLDLPNIHTAACVHSLIDRQVEWGVRTNHSVNTSSRRDLGAVSKSTSDALHHTELVSMAAVADCWSSDSVLVNTCIESATNRPQFSSYENA